MNVEHLCSAVLGRPRRSRSASAAPAPVRQESSARPSLLSLTRVCAAPVDARWLSWEEWSNCSSCGGVQVRHRGCVPPRYGGRACPQLPGPSNLLMEISKWPLALRSTSRCFHAVLCPRAMSCCGLSQHQLSHRDAALPLCPLPGVLCTRECWGQLQPGAALLLTRWFSTRVT